MSAERAKKSINLSSVDWSQMCWDYFELLSNQRMQMIGFYITIEIVLIGALFTLLNLDNRMPWAEYTVAIAISLISIIFGGLDYRTRAMIHWCEDILICMESEYCKLVNAQVNLLPMHYIGNKSRGYLFTYSKIFLFQFIIIGCFGIICLIALIYKLI